MNVPWISKDTLTVVDRDNFDLSFQQNKHKFRTCHDFVRSDIVTIKVASGVPFLK